MSGTIHNENVMKEVFGLEKFKIIYEEVKIHVKILLFLKLYPINKLKNK
jgi:hypothetical protein